MKKHVRRGWQRHAVKEYKDYLDDEKYHITAPIDPHLLYPDENRYTAYVSWDTYFENWELYNKGNSHDR